MDLAELAQFKLPTAAELAASAPEEVHQWAAGRYAFTWEKIEAIVAARAVGVSVIQSAASAGIHRQTWVAWRKDCEWLADLVEQWQSYGATRIAARVALMSDTQGTNGDPGVASTNARWLAERLSEDHAPAPKREVVTAHADEHGARIVIEHMDGIVQPPELEQADD